MRKPPFKLDCSDLIQQIDDGLAEIDREIGVVTYSAITQATNGVAEVSRDALEITDKLMDSSIMRFRTAEERSRWNAFSKLPAVNFAMSKMSPATSQKVASTMAKWIGLPSLLAQATSVRKLIYTSTSVASVFSAMMNTDLGSQLTNSCAQLTGLDVTAAETVTGMSIVLAACGVASLLKTAVARHANDRYDHITARAQAWNDNLDRGWRTWMPRAIWIGLNKMANPHPLLSDNTLDALTKMSRRTPTNHQIPQTEALAIAAVTDSLNANFGMLSFRAGHVAINLLAHEEHNPNKLLSILKTRDIPQEWVDQYQFDPDYCVGCQP
jgi:hypothetical protein